MIEHVEQFHSEGQRIPFLELERTLNAGVVEPLTWPDKGIAPDVAELPVDNHIVELILRARERGPTRRITPKIRIEVYEVHAVQAEANTRIAGTRSRV